MNQKSKTFVLGICLLFNYVYSQPLVQERVEIFYIDNSDPDNNGGLSEEILEILEPVLDSLIKEPSITTMVFIGDDSSYTFIMDSAELVMVVDNLYNNLTDYSSNQLQEAQKFGKEVSVRNVSSSQKFRIHFFVTDYSPPKIPTGIPYLFGILPIDLYHEIALPECKGEIVFYLDNKNKHLEKRIRQTLSFSNNGLGGISQSPINLRLFVIPSS